MITQHELKQILDYDKQTGVFTWRKSICRRMSVGKVAGCVEKGYIRVRIEGKPYFAHRLAWLYENGYFPENNIDHIDRNPSNNSIMNLRAVSQSCNVRNANMLSNNKSGVKGLYFSKSRGKYEVTIVVHGKKKFLGRFVDFTEGVAHRLSAEQCLNWNECDNKTTAQQHMENYVHENNS